MPNESSYQYTATPVAYGPSGELIPQYTPFLKARRLPEEIIEEQHAMGQAETVEAQEQTKRDIGKIAAGVVIGLVLLQMFGK